MDSTLQDAVLTKDIKLTVHFPSRDLFLGDVPFDDRAHQILAQFLPQVLQRINVPTDQVQGRVDSGIPSLTEIVQKLFNEAGGL